MIRPAARIAGQDGWVAVSRTLWSLLDNAKNTARAIGVYGELPPIAVAQEAESQYAATICSPHLPVRHSADGVPVDRLPTRTSRLTSVPHIHHTSAGPASACRNAHTLAAASRKSLFPTSPTCSQKAAVPGSPLTASYATTAAPPQHQFSLSHLPIQSSATSLPANVPTSPSLSSDELAEVDMAELMQVLLQPMPISKVHNQALHNISVKHGGMLYMDPTLTLQSTMRMLHILKQTLRQGGHVYIVSGVETLSPLLRHAAYCCANPNVWWHLGEWKAGCLAVPNNARKSTQSKFYTTIADGDPPKYHKFPPLVPPGTQLSSFPPSASVLFSADHQPGLQLLAKRGIHPPNVHCPEVPVMMRPRPRLDTLDKWRLLQRSKKNPNVDKLLRQVVNLETTSARLPLRGCMEPSSSPRAALGLVIALDLTCSEGAITEAYESNIPTASVVNEHSDLSRITYPIYAAEQHTGYQRWLLSWILRIVNLKVEDGPEGPPE